jgi:hypothetical protein
MLAENKWLMKWVEKYGGVTSYCFMVYGPLSPKDVAILNFAVTDHLVLNGLERARYSNILEEVDITDARIYGTRRGWSIQWAFGGNIDYEFVPQVIQDGLKFLELQFDYIGRVGDECV